MHDGFEVIRWRSAGMTAGQASLLWSLSVAAEVVVFLFVGRRLLERLGPGRAMALSALAGIVRWSAAAETAWFPVMALVEPLHGLTFALLHLACMDTIGRVVPASLAATAQAFYGDDRHGSDLGGGDARHRSALCPYRRCRLLADGAAVRARTAACARYPAASRSGAPDPTGLIRRALLTRFTFSRREAISGRTIALAAQISRPDELSMSSLLTRLATRAAYGASQGPRLAWYAGHSLAMRKLSQAARKLEGARARPPARASGPVPDRNRLLADMAELLKRDVANVEAGLYPLPVDHDGSLATLLNRSRLFFEDLPRIHRRRQSGIHSDVLTEEMRGKRPRYYLQNFHFQSGGWMTDEFGATLRHPGRSLLRRHGERHAAASPAGTARDLRGARPARVAAARRRHRDGTLPRVRQAGLAAPARPRSRPVGSLYPRGGQHLSRWSSAMLTVANAESIPVPDASQDAVTSIFLFHELPPKVRRTVFREFARVLKPGGRLVLVDSLQFGDKPEYDGSLELFPQNFHEPYFASYAREDFGMLGVEKRADAYPRRQRVRIEGDGIRQRRVRNLRDTRRISERRAILSLGFVLLLGASCSHTSKTPAALQPDKVASVVVGQSSRTDVFALLGRPTRSERSAAGEAWVYEVRESKAGRDSLLSGAAAGSAIVGAFVPYAGLVGSGIGLANAAGGSAGPPPDTSSLTVAFGPNGIVRDCVDVTTAAPALSSASENPGARGRLPSTACLSGVDTDASRSATTRSTAAEYDTESSDAAAGPRCGSAHRVTEMQPPGPCILARPLDFVKHRMQANRD